MLDRLIPVVRLAGRLALRAVLAFSILFLLLVGVGPWTGRYRVVTVLTGSMRPGMPAGSAAIVTPVSPSAIRVGDVVTYQAPLADHRVVTHRVVKVITAGEHPVIQTKGDANVSPDPWLARVNGSPAWRATAVIPHLGTAIRSLRSPTLHRVGTVGAPILLIVVWLGGIWSAGDSETVPGASEQHDGKPIAPTAMA
jgi:signal peptidase